jgi:hypothetical protein
MSPVCKLLTRILSEEKKNRRYELRLHKENNGRKLQNGCGRNERMT